MADESVRIRPESLILRFPDARPSGITTRLGTVYPYRSLGSEHYVGVGGIAGDKFLTADEANEAAAALAAYAWDIGSEQEEIIQAFARDLHDSGLPGWAEAEATARRLVQLGYRKQEAAQ